MSTTKKTVVADYLRDALARGVYRPGERLPGEEELAEELDVSRATARLGMRILQDEGRIAIQVGRGAFVANHQPITHLAEPVTADGDSGSLESGYSSRLRQAGHGDVDERVRVSLDTMRPRVAKRLINGPEQQSPNAGLVVIRASEHLVDGGLWQTQITYFPFSIANNTALMTPEHLAGGIAGAMRALGFHEEWNRDLVGARMPSQEEADAFGLGPGTPLLVQERVTYEGQRPLRFTETFMPANRHQLLYTGGDAPENLPAVDTDLSIFEH
ncbi:GntR family transcriptional regulator [Nocardiopsis terrae]